MKKILLVCGMLITATSFAKLPALSDQEKTKADETKAKAAWSDKVASYQLCKAQDKAAAAYLKTKNSTASSSPASTAVAIPVTMPVTMPACADPGPYVSPLTAAVALPVPIPVPADVTLPKK